MDHNRTKNQNIVYAINDYIEHGLLPVIKYHLDENVMKSSRLVLTKKLLSISYKKGLTYFMQNIFYQEIEKAPAIKQLVEELIRLDNSGMFVQILLREFMYKGNRYALDIVGTDFRKESLKFLKFLYQIANREKGQTCQLIFHGKFYKIGIILVAKTDTYDEHGLSPYTYRFKNNVQRGLEDIYLCSRGDVKVNITLKIAKILRKKYKTLAKPKVFFYNGRYKNQNHKGVCIAFNNIS